MCSKWWGVTGKIMVSLTKFVQISRLLHLPLIRMSSFLLVHGEYLSIGFLWLILERKIVGRKSVNTHFPIFILSTIDIQMYGHYNRYLDMVSLIWYLFFFLMSYIYLTLKLVWSWITSDQANYTQNTVCIHRKSQKIM